MAYRVEIENLRRLNRILAGVIAGMGVVILGLWAGWYTAPDRIQLAYPPDLRSGGTFGLHEVPPGWVYAFAYYVLQQVNYWQEDGSKDYAANLYRYSAYMTPVLRETLRKDLEERGRQGELLWRTRTVAEVPGHGYAEKRVDVLGNDAWVVWLDLDIRESVRGMPVKNAAVRYPVRVVRYAVNPEQNPFGLALDGYAGDGPRRLSEAELREHAR